MLTSLAFIFILGLALGALCEKCHLPRIIGLLVTGIILGPYVLNVLDVSILNISSDLRKLALIIILIKAGLSLNIDDLKKVGRPALLMSFVPACFEILAYVIFAPKLFGISVVEACLMGAVIGAVSPAVVVPRMVKLMDEGYGTKQGIPQMILAGASCDDVFVIVLFTTFLNMAQGGSASVMDFINIPVSIVLGVVVGVVVGFILYQLFEQTFQHGTYIRSSNKVIIILGVSFLLVALEGWLDGIVSISSLLAVMSMSLVIAQKCPSFVVDGLKEKFGKLWLGAEILLFVLVGAAVDIQYALSAGLLAIVMIVLGLCIRAIGVMVAVSYTGLSKKEKAFCVLAYIPKATVQAAIGSIPLAAGLPCGMLVLSVAVVAILLTAPLGAMAIDFSYRKLLSER